MLFAALLVVAALAVSVRAGGFKHMDSEHIIRDSWIVVLKQGADAPALKVAMGAQNEVKIGDGFHALLVKGAPQTAMAAFADHEHVDFIEPEQMYHVIGGEQAAAAAAAADCTTEENPLNWGLWRVSNRDVNSANEFHYDTAGGANVNVYVLDTGIRTTHQDFEDRAVWGGNFAGGQPSDGHGHGTHVASTVGGKAYGIARKAMLYAVKVCTPQGSCPSAGILQGISYAAENGTAHNGPAVANMSLGGPRSSASNNAVNAAVDQGVHFAVAAGNENTDACTRSPASAEKAVTVGATDIGTQGGGQQQDIRSFFSNYGPCVDVFAPGSDITGAWIGSDTATRTVSGTSMASPHTAGVIAAYVSENADATPAEVQAFVRSSSTKDAIDLNCSNAKCNESDNFLLYIDNCGMGSADEVSIDF